MDLNDVFYFFIEKKRNQKVVNRLTLSLVDYLQTIVVLIIKLSFHVIVIFISVLVQQECWQE